MPILNARAQTRDHRGAPVPADRALRRFGPRVRVTLAPLEDQIRFFADRGETPPTPLAGLALIDTGASLTCVDREAAGKAGLAVVDSGPIASATHRNEVVPIYAGRLNLAGIPLNIDAKRAYGANLEPQGLIALIGRDMLTNCVLVYNGPDGSFSLSL